MGFPTRRAVPPDSDEGGDAPPLARACSGDPRAFAAVVERWYRDLGRFFAFLGWESHAVEDHLQETFLRLFRNRLRYRHSAGRAFLALLYRIAKSVHVDALRKRRRSPRLVPLELGDDRPALEGNSVRRLEERLDLQEAVDALPERLRWVVLLNVYQGLAYREVADVLGIPVGTVKSRMHDATKRLREVVRDRAYI